MLQKTQKVCRVFGALLQQSSRSSLRRLKWTTSLQKPTEDTPTKQRRAAPDFKLDEKPILVPSNSQRMLVQDTTHAYFLQSGIPRVRGTHHLP